MIARIWHGFTSLSNAKPYREMLKSEIFTGIESQNIKGFISIELLSRKSNTEVEFITIMKFESLEAIKIFAGEDYERAVVPEKARKLLSHFDEKSQHYEILKEV